MIDLDKNRLVETPPSCGKPPDYGLTKIQQAPPKQPSQAKNKKNVFACELHMCNGQV